MNSRIRYPDLWNADQFRALMDGRTNRQAATVLGCSPYTISRATSRLQKKPPTFPQLSDRVWLYNQHIIQRNGPKKIASIIGCSQSSVSQALYRFGLSGCNPKVPAEVREAEA